MPSGRISDLPKSTRRYTFALTPLADAMFQLLIFFMLTSSLTPYSLLTLHSGSNANNTAPVAKAVPNNQKQEQPSQTATWLIENNQIIASGQTFNFSQLSQMAEALIAAKTPRVLLITKPTAQVQDLVVVLEKLSAAGIETVQIVGSARQ
jgi:biopolymer transport protein ExbD